MKRCILGTVLLLVLLAGSLAVWWGMETLHQPVSGELTQAAALAQSGEEDQAKKLALQAKDHWEQHWHFVAAFANHTPMEEIDGLFGALEAYPASSPEFAACCQQLARRTEAMAEAHSFTWWNLM